MKRCKILINIDTLFDTYLGTVTKIYPDIVLSLIKKGYFLRKHNKLSLIEGSISDNLINETYKNRDMDILRLSGRTNIVNIITKYIMQSQSNKEHPASVEYSLVINTFPYNLNKEELKELFYCFKYVFNLEAITRVHIPIKDITIKLLKDNFNRFILYDFNEWYGYRLKEFETIRIPHVNIVFPLWFMEGNENCEEIEEVIKWTTSGLSSLMDIEYVTLADMSYCPPKELLNNKENTNESDKNN